MPTAPMIGTSQTIEHCAAFWNVESMGHLTTRADTTTFANAMAQMARTDSANGEAICMPNVVGKGPPEPEGRRAPASAACRWSP